MLVLLIAAAGFLALGTAEAWSDSPTFDEPVYVSAGLAGVLHQDLTYNDEHPPAPKVLAALPVLLAHPVIPSNADWSGNDERAYSADFIRAQLAAGRLRQVTFASRLVPLAESAAVAFAIYGLAYELFGAQQTGPGRPGDGLPDPGGSSGNGQRQTDQPGADQREADQDDFSRREARRLRAVRLGAMAGTLAGLLWLAAPLVLGVGHLDGTDMPFALTVTLSCWALARWLRVRTRRALVWTGLALGAVTATSISGLLVVAVALAVVAGASWRQSGVRAALGRACLAGVLTWAVLWISYAAIDPGVLAKPSIIAPQPFLAGIAYLNSYNPGAAPGYLAGISFSGGQWWFWPVSIVIKWPAAIWITLVAGLIAWIWTDRTVRRRGLLALALPALVLTAFTVTTPLNIGVRLLLPVVALWAAAAGALVPAVAAAAPAWRRAATGVLAIAVAAAVAATAASFPSSLAWTALPWRPGYAAATNSNLDWGQGLYALTSWSRGRDPWVGYFGPRGLTTAAAISSSRPLLGTPPTQVSGWVAVSATALTSADRQQLGWLRNFCPVRVLAGSILIYHLAAPPDGAQARAPATATPPSPCQGTWSTPTPGPR